MRKIDIRAYKSSLRERSKKFRRELDPSEKAKMDSAILKRLRSLYQYREARTVLCYVSTPIEVDTHGIIRDAWRHGKRVAVPRCVDGTKEMQFYYINSFEDLEKRTFGVLEPIPERCEMATDFSGSVCITPALMYDLKGYRLGYGSGYYDRFLSGYPGYKIGITYKACILRFLHYGRFDIPVDMLVTEGFFRLTNRENLRRS